MDALQSIMGLTTDQRRCALDRAEPSNFVPQSKAWRKELNGCFGTNKFAAEIAAHR